MARGNVESKHGMLAPLKGLYQVDKKAVSNITPLFLRGPPQSSSLKIHCQSSVQEQPTHSMEVPPRYLHYRNCCHIVRNFSFVAAVFKRAVLERLTKIDAKFFGRFLSVIHASDKAMVCDKFARAL